MATPPSIDDELASLTSSLWQDDLIFFPIRHHSPACSRQIEALIQSVRPRAILVEGPTSFEPLIPHLLDSRTKPPVACYSTFIDHSRRLGKPGEGEPDFGPARFAAYYPFAEYSPEWIALKIGAAVGAKLHFIDLDYAEQILAEKRTDGSNASARVQSLLGEQHLTRSRYLKALAQKSGCRNFDELWDHLFETPTQNLDPKKFAYQLAAYCWMARRETPAEELAADATSAREEWMAACIQRVLREPKEPGTGPVLIITGGFHTVVLPKLVASGPRTELKLSSFGENETLHVLIRYSFNQLDALNGYSAGMPSPSYYQKVWELRQTSPADGLDQVAASLLVDISRQTRKRKLATAVSTADTIAALHQARLLAKMRGHAGPLREDLLDGVRGCFSKGGIGDEGIALLGLARELMAGLTVGEIPDDAGVPPLVADFRRVIQELRLGGTDTARRKLALELYRKARHRRISRLLHSLEFIGVPFGRLLAGPDFVRGTDTSRLVEHWECAWTPRTEAGLVDASIYGATITDATLAKLQEVIAHLAKEGKSRNAQSGVEVLIRACRMGLHNRCGELVGLIIASLTEDSSFSRVVGAAGQFVLLWQAREPLEGHNLIQLPELVATALMRAIMLVPGLSNCPSSEADNAIEALLAMRTLLTEVKDLVDAEIFWNGLNTLRSERTCEPSIAGAAIGMLHGVGRMDASEVAQISAGHLGATGLDWSRRVGFLRGLLRACREIAWQSQEILATVDRLLAEWTEEEFVRAIPDLRLAFADLTPRETDKVGVAVAGLHGEKTLGDLFNRGVSTEEFAAHRELTLRVMDRLREDGLGGWIGNENQP